MKRRKAPSLGANQAGRATGNLFGGNTDSISQFPSAINFMMSQPDAPASSGQVSYCKVLRRRVGLDRWNRTKTALGIATPGTEALSKAQAAALISALLGSKGERQ